MATHGGARSRSGPAPDPMSLRQLAKADDWIDLPAKRTGATPAWPLADESKRERAIWLKEWRRPQAVMWERNGQELEVALYVRTLVAAEAHDATAATRTLLLRQQEGLGLTLPGLRSLRWRIPADEVGTKRQTRKATAPRSTSRRRLAVVADAAGE